ncbi:uncharacterized protein LOC111274545 isoform X1 [Durio zibethinus]|uniref:Acyl-coenzyme A thioesterase 13 n=1 Tax=Durio zibethinus TaxID=66656 RepID=A0A6P5WHW2_DURZI|nr:uncharacterized protein LOC111274545 isoform X1 [Durio zibethinus]
MEDGSLQKSLKWLGGLSNGIISHELEALTLEGLQILHGQKGFIRCNFVVPSRVSDADGNWHVGAMATLIDDVGAAAIYSVADHVKASLDFDISFHSTAKIQEEVEIEAKVIGQKGKLTQVVVDVRRKGNGELIALGKQWMASNKDSMKASQVDPMLHHHYQVLYIFERWIGWIFSGSKRNETRGSCFPIPF